MFAPLLASPAEYPLVSVVRSHCRETICLLLAKLVSAESTVAAVAAETAVAAEHAGVPAS